MKRLITVEEHYQSTAITDKIRKIFEEQGTKEQKNAPAATDPAPGVTDLGKEGRARDRCAAHQLRVRFSRNDGTRILRGPLQ